MEAFKIIKEEKSSSLVKIVRLLSSLYLLPLNISVKRSKVSFSFFSCQTFTSFLLTFVPTILLMVLVCYNIDYYTEVANSLYEIYT